jgi:mono/diheme cytochrome c family protein
MRWIFLLFIPVVYAQAQPEQVKRGRAIFFESAAGSRCGNCHSLEQKGTAVGPDISRLAMLNPRAIKMAVLSTATQYVQVCTTKDGSKFPFMKSGEEGQQVKFFDLSTNPPKERTLDKATIDEIEPNSSWKHPPESAKLTPAQLADVIGFMRFAAKGETKPVKTEEVE